MMRRHEKLFSLKIVRWNVAFNQNSHVDIGGKGWKLIFLLIVLLVVNRRNVSILGSNPSKLKKKFLKSRPTTEENIRVMKVQLGQINCIKFALTGKVHARQVNGFASYTQEKNNNNIDHLYISSKRVNRVTLIHLIVWHVNAYL